MKTLPYVEWYQSGIAIIHGREFLIPPNYPVPAINTLGTPMFEAWLRYTDDVYVCDYTSMLADQGEFD